MDGRESRLEREEGGQNRCDSKRNKRKWMRGPCMSVLADAISGSVLTSGTQPPGMPPARRRRTRMREMGRRSVLTIPSAV